MKMAADHQFGSSWFSLLHNLNSPGYWCFYNSLTPQKSFVSLVLLVVITGNINQLRPTLSYPEVEGLHFSF